MDSYKQAFTLIMDKDEDKFIALSRLSDFDVSWKDNNDNSLLTQSIRYGVPKVFEQLMKLNANINMPNGYGTTPLMWAVKEQKFEMFAQIMAKHPDLSIKNQEDDTATKSLLEHRDKKIIEQFILSLNNRQSLSLLESHILQTEHPFSDYAVGVIGIAKLQLKLNNSLSDKSTKENKRKL